MTRRTLSRTATALVAALFLNSCDSSSAPTPNPPSSPTPASPAPSGTPAPGPTPLPTESDLVIEIVAIDGNMSFVPDNASVQAGQQVRWHNAHFVTHTATQDGGGFDTGLIAPGATSAPVTISATGTLSYHCEVHPSMVGSVRLAQ